MTDLLALAVECETAQADEVFRSRALSDRVLVAFGWRTERRGFKNINGATESVDVWLAPGQDFRREDFEWLTQEAAHNMWSNDDDHRPDPATSLDAAKALLAQAVDASGVRLETQTMDGGSWARVSWQQGGWNPSVEARGNTLELTLTALALRARVKRDEVIAEKGVDVHV